MKFIFFDSPGYLLLGLLVTIILLWYWKRTGITLSGPGSWKRALKILLVALIFLGLAEPKILMRTWNQCILFLVDVSNSIREDERKEIDAYLNLKITEKGQEDRMGILNFGERVAILIPAVDLTKQDLLTVFSHPIGLDVNTGYTDIEGAMNMAINVFPEGYKKKIVLISDGNENAGKAANLYEKLRGINIEVDVIPIGGIFHEEVVVESIYAPRKVRTGNPFHVDVVINSNTAAKGEMQILIDHELVKKVEIDIHQGDHQIYKFPVVLKEGGFHSISAHIFAEKDTFFVNNKAETILYSFGRQKALFIIDPSSEESWRPEDRSYLHNVLGKNGIDAVTLPCDRLPVRGEEYSKYDVIILNNIPSNLLLPQQMEAISSAVHDLGVGFIMVGGGHSIGARGYARTPIEKALPVKLTPSKGGHPSSIDLILVVDKSGSMSEGEDSKFRMVIESSQAVIEILNEEDRMGVIAFDSKPYTISDLSSINNRDELVFKIQGLTPRGGTDFYPALVQAFDWLEKSDAPYKHILLLSDGRTRERDFKGLVKEIVGKEISISTIGIGKDSNIPLLKEIANAGKGRFFNIGEDLKGLSDIFKEDTLMTIRDNLTVEETFTPRLKDPDPILNGIPLITPKMHGYMVTSSKKTAIIPVASHHGDPVVGLWMYGLGKAAIFTGDDGAWWSRDWVLWDGFGRLWLQLVKRTMRTETGGDENQVFKIRGSEVEVQYTTPEGEVPHNVMARVLPPDGRAFDLKLIHSSLGMYHGIMEDLGPGRYIVQVVEDSPDKAGKVSMGAFVINGALEFVRLNKNIDLLKEIATQNGGNILSKEQYIPIWPYLYVVAVLIFLADVAVYREIHTFLKIGSKLVKNIQGLRSA